MSTIHCETACDKTGGGNSAALGAGDWLCLAAAPTFAAMALLTGIYGDGAPAMLCSAAHAMSPLCGMVPMYLLMSVFHWAPWLRMFANRRSGVGLLLGVGYQ